MKILILGPMNYDDARRDLKILNYQKQVYSVYYTLEGLEFMALEANEFKKGLENKTEIALLLASKIEEKEYFKFNVFFGPMSKRFSFDKIIAYNTDILSTQEERIAYSYKPFYEEFYSTKDATHVYSNLMEALLSAESKTERSNN